MGDFYILLTCLQNMVTHLRILILKFDCAFEGFGVFQYDIKT